MWFEIDQILSIPYYSSWNPPGGDARNSPIYVVVRYTGAGGAGGSNANGPNDYTSRAVNGIDVAITSVDQVDLFSWAFSHELAERMSQGTGVGLNEISQARSPTVSRKETSSMRGGWTDPVVPS
jgi:hypothetical protein